MDCRRRRCVYGRHRQGSQSSAGGVRSSVGSLRPFPPSRTSNRLKISRGAFSRRTAPHASIGKRGCNGGIAARLDRSAVAMFRISNGIGLESLTDAAFPVSSTGFDPCALLTCASSVTRVAASRLKRAQEVPMSDCVDCEGLVLARQQNRVVGEPQ
jgi:hypothetical protein